MQLSNMLLSDTVCNAHLPSCDQKSQLIHSIHLPCSPIIIIVNDMRSMGNACKVSKYMTMCLCFITVTMTFTLCNYFNRFSSRTTTHGHGQNLNSHYHYYKLCKKNYMQQDTKEKLLQVVICSLNKLLSRIPARIQTVNHNCYNM